VFWNRFCMRIHSDPKLFHVRFRIQIYYESLDLDPDLDLIKVLISLEKKIRRIYRFKGFHRILQQWITTYPWTKKGRFGI
jgi:hypothetical protein